MQEEYEHDYLCTCARTSVFLFLRLATSTASAEKFQVPWQFLHCRWIQNVLYWDVFYYYLYIIITAICSQAFLKLLWDWYIEILNKQPFGCVFIIAHGETCCVLVRFISLGHTKVISCPDLLEFLWLTKNCFTAVRYQKWCCFGFGDYWDCAHAAPLLLHNYVLYFID